jgi:MFS family permease
MTQNANQGTIIIAAIAMLGFCNVATGMMVQLIPLVMEQLGLSARMIGLNSAAGQFGVFIMGLALPLILQRVAPRQLVISAVILMMVTLALFAFTQPVYAWYAIRFFNGFAITALYTISETWITTAAGTERRARVMGIYTTVLTATFGVAPFVVSYTGFNSTLPWFIGVACLVPALIVMMKFKASEIDTKEKGGGFLSILGRTPVIFICLLATTTFEGISLSFFTIYGMRNGLSFETASQIFGAGIIGCMLFFYPTGQLADRWSRGGTAIVCALVAIIFAVLTAYTITSPAIWPVTIVLRAGAFGILIVAMSTIGDTFKGTDLIQAGAIVSMCWGLGGIAGPPVAGFVIDTYGINTLPWMMTACYVVVLAALAVNGWRMAPAGLAAKAPVAQQT